MSFIVPAFSPLAAPPPVTGDDNDDDGGGVRPRLPTERWRRDRGEVRRARGEEWHHAPALAPSSARAPAPAPDSGSGAPFIESSPAVPVPRGVRDTATILPMPAPGVKRQVLLACFRIRSISFSPRTAIDLSLTCGSFAGRGESHFGSTTSYGGRVRHDGVFLIMLD